MGHASIKTTSDIYGHLFEQAHERARSLMDDMFSAAAYRRRPVAVSAQVRGLPAAVPCEGTPQDALTYVDGTLLVDLWGELVLPRDIREAWAPLIERAA